MHSNVRAAAKATLLLVTILFTNNCGGQRVNLMCDPGEGEAAQAGQRFFQPLIDALEQYKAETGNYPNAMYELVPKYIDKVPDLREQERTPDEQSKVNNISPHSNIGGSSIAVRPDEKRFVITFYFYENKFCLLGTGGRCEFYSGGSRWQCS